MSSEFEQIVFSSSQPDFEQRLGNLRSSLLRVACFEPSDPRADKVKTIIADVAERGAPAVAEYTEKFDGVKLSPEQFRLHKEDLQKAHSGIDNDLLASLRKAIDNVKKYQSEIFIGNSKTCTGAAGIKYTPIKRVGICVPAASAALPSTVIMTAVPAIAAGVKQIVVVSAPRYQDSIHPVILAVCYELGIDEVYRISGVQAVAALAYGTETIAGVHKIVGPGNTWVQTAKRQVFGTVDIDSIAGPSEVLIIANEDARADWVAADMLSQAEHGPGSAVVFTDSQNFAQQVLQQLAVQVKQLPRVQATADCLKKYSGIVVFESLNSAISAADDFAAEHLQIQCGSKSGKIAESIENAGAIFIGEYSPVATGDYWAGPSHTLPTGGSARFFSALSANDFVKSTSIIEYDKQKLSQSAPDIIRLAQAEGLEAHAKSVQIRQKD